MADPINPKAIEMLENEGFEVIQETEITPDQLLNTIANFDALIVRSRTQVTQKVIEKGKKRLKIIGRAGVGLENIDVKTAEKYNIKVIRSPRGSSVSVAELIMGLTLALFRSIPLVNNGLKEGEWMKKVMGHLLQGKKMGIIGFGNVGAELAKRAQAFGMNIFTCDVSESALERAKENGCSCSNLEDIVANSDVVAICCELTDETRNLINKDILNLMKSTAYLVNTARGDIVNEEDLYEALREGKIAGAALDTFVNEPNPNPNLVKLPNVITTPHIGAQTVEANEAVSIILAEQMIEILKSKESENE